MSYQKQPKDIDQKVKEEIQRWEAQDVQKAQAREVLKQEHLNFIAVQEELLKMQLKRINRPKELHRKQELDRSEQLRRLEEEERSLLQELKQMQEYRAFQKDEFIQIKSGQFPKEMKDVVGIIRLNFLSTTCLSDMGGNDSLRAGSKSIDEYLRVLKAVVAGESDFSQFPEHLKAFAKDLSDALSFERLYKISSFQRIYEKPKKSTEKVAEKRDITLTDVRNCVLAHLKAEIQRYDRNYQPTVDRPFQIPPSVILAGKECTIAELKMEIERRSHAMMQMRGESANVRFSHQDYITPVCLERTLNMLKRSQSDPHEAELYRLVCARFNELMERYKGTNPAAVRPWDEQDRANALRPKEERVGYLRPGSPDPGWREGRAGPLPQFFARRGEGGGHGDRPRGGDYGQHDRHFPVHGLPLLAGFFQQGQGNRFGNDNRLLWGPVIGAVVEGPVNQPPAAFGDGPRREEKRGPFRGYFRIN